MDDACAIHGIFIMITHYSSNIHAASMDSFVAPMLDALFVQS